VRSIVPLFVVRRTPEAPIRCGAGALAREKLLGYRMLGKRRLLHRSFPGWQIGAGQVRVARDLRARASTEQILIALLLLASLVACSKPPDAAPSAATEAPKSTGLESIPLPDPSKYPRLADMSNWKNPYLVVREDGVGLVDLSNHEVHILTPEQVQAELVSLPSSAWPYGRVVLVTEAAPKNPTDQAKAEVRKNRALLAGTLKELDVVMREFP